MAILLLLAVAVVAALAAARRHRDDPDLSARFVVATTRLLPSDREEWGRAMVAELAHVHRGVPRWRFTAGALRVTLFPPVVHVARTLIAAAAGITLRRRTMPMVEMPDYTLEGEQGPVRLAEIFDGASQLIVYNHMWLPGEEWQCGGCTGFTSQFTRLDLLHNYDARFVIVTQGPIDEALAYKRRVGNQMT